MVRLLGSHLLAAVAVVCISIYTGLLTQNPLEPTLWQPQDVFPLPSIVPNTHLSHAMVVHEGENPQVLAPESFAIDPDSGRVYAGLSYGVVVELDQNGNYLHDVIFIGGNLYNTSREWCRSEALANRLPYSVINERQCGRPLGLRLTRSGLYIADAYHGIFLVPAAALASREGVGAAAAEAVQHLVSPSQKISKCAIDSKVVSMRPLFFNDVVVDEDAGIVYFTDSSYKNTRSENRREVIDGAPRGRLFAYRKDRGTLNALLCGLHFPNGLELLHINGVHTLLLVESARFRILAVHNPAHVLSRREEKIKVLKPLNKCGEHGELHAMLQMDPVRSPVSVYLDRAPGFMDNIRQYSSGGAERETGLLVGVAAKSTQPFSLLHLAYQSNLLRRLVGWFVPMPWIERLIPKYGLVLAIPDSRHPNKTLLLHDPSGATAWVSEAHVHPHTQTVFLGTHHNPSPLRVLLHEDFHWALGASGPPLP